MNKRTFEVILIVSIVFISIYFLFYHFYFHTICENKNGFIGKNSHTTLVLMGQCKDSYVCSIENIKYDDLQRNVTSWECNKKNIDYFELNYYRDTVNNLLKK